MGCVYIATNKINGKVYIGKTIKNLEKRKQMHFFHARKKGKKFFYFQKAIDKYGKDFFSWEILYQSDDDKLLCQHEALFIAAYNSQDPEYGYNLCSGGEGSIPNEETRRKLKQKQTEYSSKSDVRRKRSEDIKKRLSIPEFKERHAESVRIACKKPEWQEKHKKVMDFIHNDPVIKEKVVLSNKEKAKNPDWLKANQKSLDAAHEASVKPVVCIETGIIYHGTLDANRRIGVNAGVVTHCCRGRKKHGLGFQWRYATPEEDSAYRKLREIRGKDVEITIFDLHILDK